MALKAQAPVVPVAIKGARDAMQKGSPLIYPVRVTVRFGTPIETAAMTLDDRDGSRRSGPNRRAGAGAARGRAWAQRGRGSDGGVTWTC